MIKWLLGTDTKPQTIAIDSTMRRKFAEIEAQEADIDTDIAQAQAREAEKAAGRAAFWKAIEAAHQRDKYRVGDTPCS